MIQPTTTKVNTFQTHIHTEHIFTIIILKILYNNNNDHHPYNIQIVYH